MDSWKNHVWLIKCVNAIQIILYTLIGYILSYNLILNGALSKLIKSFLQIWQPTLARTSFDCRLWRWQSWYQFKFIPHVICPLPQLYLGFGQIIMWLQLCSKQTWIKHHMPAHPSNWFYSDYFFYLSSDKLAHCPVWVPRCLHYLLLCHTNRDS